MSYYWFNIQELLEKANDRYCNCGGKEKAAKYHTGNKDVMKEKAKFRNLSAKKQRQKNNLAWIDTKTWKSIKEKNKQQK